MAILLFAYAAVNHWHSTPAGQEQCLVCHVAHSLSIDLSCSALLSAPAAVARLILPARPEPRPDFSFGQVSSRAPPLAA